MMPLLLSVVAALLALVLALAAGVPLGAWLAGRRRPVHQLVRLLCTLPMLLPPTVLGYMALLALGGQSPIGGIWERVTGSRLVFSRTAVVFAATIAAFPYLFRAADSAFAGVPAELIATARSLGATRARRFWSVRLPLAARGIGAGAALGLSRALGEFGITLMIGGNIDGRTRTAALALYDAVEAGDSPRALWLAGSLTLAAACLLLLAERAYTTTAP
jgi:molybdate transport system permease protein